MKGCYRDQFERAVLSICLNLAEGSGKPSAKDQKRLFYIALGSLREVQALVAVLGITELEKQVDVLGAHVYKLCTA